MLDNKWIRPVVGVRQKHMECLLAQRRSIQRYSAKESLFAIPIELNDDSTRNADCIRSLALEFRGALRAKRNCL